MMRVRTLMALTSGLAVGYVAGAAAGRPAFERLRSRADDVVAQRGVKDAAERLQETGEGVARATADLAATATSDMVDRATTKVEQQLNGAQERMQVIPTPNGKSHA